VEHLAPKTADLAVQQAIFDKAIAAALGSGLARPRFPSGVTVFPLSSPRAPRLFSFPYAALGAK
jgi:hypothetical protein